MIHGEKVAGTRYIIENIMKNSSPCPYWIGHIIFQKRLLSNLLFEKWYKRPQASYRLYWRLHPEEYEKSIRG